MPRYNKARRLLNDIEFYDFLKKKRNVSRIKHYSTPVMSHPDSYDRASLITTGYIWKYGDRFYKLAHNYYDDSRFWWVIAWYNGYPTEADILPGDYIDIPLNISDALAALGVS